MSVQPQWRHLLLIIAATACWGIGTVLSKQALDRGVAPLTLLVIELAASCLLLAVVLLGATRHARVTRTPGLTALAWLGLLNPGLAYVLGMLGLVSVTASLAVLMWATEPLLIALLGAVFLGERAGPAAYAAVAVAVAGAMLVLFQPAGGGDAVGVALTVAAVTACACYTVLTRHLLLADSSLAVVMAQQAVALTFAASLWALAAISGAQSVGLPTDAAGWAFALVSGFVYYGLAFACFVAGLRGVSAFQAGALIPLIPVFGLAGAFVAGERLADRQWVGVALVVAATLVGSAAAARNRGPSPATDQGAR